MDLSSRKKDQTSSALEIYPNPLLEPTITKTMRKKILSQRLGVLVTQNTFIGSLSRGIYIEIRYLRSTEEGISEVACGCFEYAYGFGKGSEMMKKMMDLSENI